MPIDSLRHGVLVALLAFAAALGATFTASAPARADTPNPAAAAAYYANLRALIIDAVVHHARQARLSAAEVGALRSRLERLSFVQLRDLAIGLEYSMLQQLLPSGPAGAPGELGAIRDRGAAGSATRGRIDDALAATGPGGLADRRGHARDGETIGDGAPDEEDAAAKKARFDEEIRILYEGMTGAGTDPWYTKSFGGGNDDGENAFKIGAMIYATIVAYRKVYGGKGTPNPDAQTWSGIVTAGDLKGIDARRGANRTPNPDADTNRATGGVRTGTRQSAGLYTEPQVEGRIDAASALRAIRARILSRINPPRA